jgi:5'-AMP-activated protein kinase regulatory gamma subunit
METSTSTSNAQEEKQPSSASSSSTSTANSTSTTRQALTLNATQIECIAKFKKVVFDCMSSHMVYELIPNSGKVVVFDSELQVKHTFTGLLHNAVNCGPVWDKKKRGYVGMLSVTDFIEILVDTYVNEGHKGKANIGDFRITDWQQIMRKRGTSISRLLCTAPETSIIDAVRQLISYRVHRLAVVTDSLANTVLCILSHHKIISFICEHCKSSFDLTCTLHQSGIGVFGRQIITATPETLVIDALKLLVVNRISTLPVVDKSGRCIEVYARSDARYLIIEDAYNHLDEHKLTIADALKSKRQQTGPSELPTCQITDTLWVICQKLIFFQKHQLLCLDNDGRIEGVVSLTDIFCFIIGRDLPKVRKEETDAPMEPSTESLRLQETQMGHRKSMESINIKQLVIQDIIDDQQSPSSTSSSTPVSTGMTGSIATSASLAGNSSSQFDKARGDAMNDMEF